MKTYKQTGDTWQSAKQTKAAKKAHKLARDMRKNKRVNWSTNNV